MASKSRTITISWDTDFCGWLPRVHKSSWGARRFYWLFLAVGYYPCADDVLLSVAHDWEDK